MENGGISVVNTTNEGGFFEHPVKKNRQERQTVKIDRKENIFIRKVQHENKQLTLCIVSYF
jgi:hypothetical protein